MGLVVSPFFDSLIINQEQKMNIFQKIMAWLGKSQREQQWEQYLSHSANLFELEQRQREIERGEAKI